MGTYIARRLLLMIPTLIGITFLVFMIVAMAPGGIGAALKVSGGAMTSQSNVAEMRAYLEDRYGLDDPPVVQYVRWLGRVSPIKFGARDQVAPGGERLRAPKALKEPPLWRWFADALPAPSPAPAAGPAAREDRIAAYRKADRAFADARTAYISVSTRLREALKDYAAEVGVPEAVTRAGEVRFGPLEDKGPVATAPSWAKVQSLGKECVQRFGAAQDARAALAAAFATRPYPQSGFAIIPGTLSIGPPDFGVAYSRSRPVMDLVLTALPVTLMINFIAFPIIYLIAIPGGMLAATYRGSILDTGLGALFIALWSIPIVLAGVFAIGFLASPDYLGGFPVSGLHDNNAERFLFLPSRDGGVFQRGFLLDTLWHICLPVLCLVYTGFAILSKQCRAAMLDNFNADFVRTAKAKGVSGRDIVLRHVFRNSLLPLITMFVTIFPAMLSGSVVIERIFTIPGMGSLIIEAINLRDRELLLANTLMIAAVNLVALLLADILYALADPRVSYE